MYVLFIDETGDLGALPAPITGNDQPVFALGGLVLDAARIWDFTRDFLAIKKRFFPHLHAACKHPPELILREIKGADIRKNALRGNRNERRHAHFFMDAVVKLLQDYDARLLGRIWVKGIGQPFDSTAVYTYSVQWLMECFHQYLIQKDHLGFCVADSRLQKLNVQVAHSVFTQKFGTQKKYGRVVELPAFVHSDNHAGIQLCDLVMSALVFPISCFAYATGHIANVHVQARGNDLRARYGAWLKDREFRYGSLGSQDGGLVVSDQLGHQSRSLLFRP